MDILFSKYKVIDKIGEGSFSEVLKCEHLETGVCYAAKKLKKIYKTEESINACAEIIVARKLPYHPNILNMFEHLYDPFYGTVTFIFEIMDMSLHDYLKTKKRGLSEYQTKKYIYQVLRGIEHLHRHGLFHRDVKPENILIKFPSVTYSPFSKANTVEIIKLADLGSVRGIYSTPPYTEYISTRWYRSPECLLTVGHYGCKMDVWATGCVFYEMLTYDYDLPLQPYSWRAGGKNRLRPLFPGSNEIDQLSKIHQILGSPSIQFLSKLKTKSRNCIFFPKLKGTGLDILLPFISRNGRSVLRSMVEYDPEKRINVKRLLKNPYFDELRGHNESVNNSHSTKTNVFIKSDGLKRSMGDDGTLSGSTNLVKPKLLKREHFCDEIRKSSKGSTKSRHSSKKSGSHDSTLTSIQIPYYDLQPHVNLSSYRSLPLVEYKVLKSMGENPTILRPNRNLRNRTGRRSSEERHLKAKSNTDTAQREQDAKDAFKKQFQSKSFILPRRLRQYSSMQDDGTTQFNKYIRAKICQEMR